MKTVLLAYPDNPVGKVFIDTFLRRGITIQAVVVQTMDSQAAQGRLMAKIRKDGLQATLRRIFQILNMKLLKYSIVDIAKKNGIAVVEVAKFNSDACVDELKKLDTDLLCIVSTPILKRKVFSCSRKGCLNAHPGWLPAYRGIGANAHALKNGDSPGISVHLIDAEIDQGLLFKREQVPVHARDTVARINDRAVARGAEMMADVIEAMSKGMPSVIDISHEALGPVYRALPYSEVKKINKNIRRNGGIHAL